MVLYVFFFFSKEEEETWAATLLPGRDAKWRNGAQTLLLLTFECNVNSKPIRAIKMEMIKTVKTIVSHTTTQENTILATSPKEIWALQQAKMKRCWAIIRINEFLTRQGRSDRVRWRAPPNPFFLTKKIFFRARGQHQRLRMFFISLPTPPLYLKSAGAGAKISNNRIIINGIHKSSYSKIGYVL